MTAPIEEIIWLEAPAEGLATREVVWYGGEPPLDAVTRALARSAVTVYTDGAWVTASKARALALAARGSDHSLDVRVLLDGGLARLPEALRLLGDAGLAPALAPREPGAASLGVRLALFERLRALGLARPRLVVLPPSGPLEQRFPSCLEGGVACTV